MQAEPRLLTPPQDRAGRLSPHRKSSLSNQKFPKVLTNDTITEEFEHPKGTDEIGASEEFYTEFRRR